MGREVAGQLDAEPSSESDRAIETAIDACLGGDPEAFAVIVDLYERPIFNVAYRLTGNRDDARDITQAVLVKAFENLATFDTSRRFFSWVYRMAVNESINFLGRTRRPAPAEATLGASAPGPEEACAGSEIGRELQAALMELGHDQRAVIVLRHLRGHRYGEMARILDVPEKTVKSRLFTARRSLRQILVRRGVL